MPGLNWTVFEGLPGAADYNFEMLCRAIIRRHFAVKGTFRALNNQAGIEFDLHLAEDCSELGSAGQWFGWQCKWYDIPSGTAIGATRRAQIEDAIRKTEKYFPGITHWVLWTRHVLTAGDQGWFFGLTTTMKLLAWSSAEIDEHLCGSAALLRETYFGELILTPDNLQNLHDRAVAPVQQRWQPEVHQTMQVEDDLRGFLAEPAAWTQITDAAQKLKSELDEVACCQAALPTPLAADTERFIACGQEFSKVTEQIVQWMHEGDVEKLRAYVPEVTYPFASELRHVPRRLRAARTIGGMYATNALSTVRELLNSFGALEHYLSTSMVAVLGDAGMGKTELAVALTLPNARRSAGILLHGKQLRAGESLDDLARRITVSGQPVDSMERLVAALDAAASRSGCRLPLFIDALNEAEDPRDWKDALSSLQVLLRDYPRVVVVVSLRPAFHEDALPERVKTLELKGFGDVTWDAVHRYFKHYKIDPGETRFFTRMVGHPLTLRLYCEVTNPDRKHVVKVQGMPRNLSDLFQRYFEQVAARISSLSPRSHRIRKEDVEDALLKIGRKLWESGQRSMSKDDAKALLDPPGTRWEFSLVQHLEQNGVLLTGAGEEHGRPGDSPLLQVTLLYDLMAGHVIAEALISGRTSQQFADWFRQGEVNQAFSNDNNQRHPYAQDILKSLVTLLPRRYPRQHLWKIVDEPLRTLALLDTFVLEDRFLDDETVSAASDLLSGQPNYLRKVMRDLTEVRALSGHPLNALFLHQVLQKLSVTDRDYSWTELVRENQKDILGWIDRLEQHWKSDAQLTEADDLRAQWMCWYFTSNVQKLRDLACRAIYWYGRARSAEFVALVDRMLRVNDPYVVERMLVAALGVVVVYEHESGQHDFVEHQLPKLGRLVFDLFFAPSASAATTHILILDYARRIVTIAAKRHPQLFTPAEIERTKPPFPTDLRRRWGNSKDRYVGHYREGDDPFGFDYRNYTLGRLVPGRRNYDDDHPEFKKIKGRIRWRIYDLGYTLEQFSRLDQMIARADHSGRSEDGAKTERYGKKYAWIAFYEMAGLRMEQRKLGQTEISDFYNIDPGFPEEPRQYEIATKKLLGDKRTDTEKWLVRTDLPDVLPWLSQDIVDGQEGPWLLLDGEAWLEDRSLGRLVKVVVRALLLKPEQTTLLREAYGNPKVKLRYGGWPQPASPYNVLSIDMPPQANTIMELNFLVDEGVKDVIEIEHHFLKNGVEISIEELQGISNEYQKMIEASGKRRISKKMENAIAEKILEERGITYQPETTIRQEKITRHFDVHGLSPVIEAIWEDGKSIANPAWKATVPISEIVSHFDWRRRSNTFNFEDAAGRLRSLYVTFGNPDSYTDRQSFTYIDQVSLLEFARQNGLELTWIIHGERSRSTDAFQSRWGGEGDEQVYYTYFMGAYAHSDVQSQSFTSG